MPLRRPARVALLTAALVVGACGRSGGLDPEAAKLSRSPEAGRVDTRLLFRIEAHILRNVDWDRSVSPQLATLTPGQRGLVALQMTDGEIQNGGFDQYFWNSTGELADEALEATRLFGARAYEAILRDAFALYPGGRVPEDRAERQRVLDRQIRDSALGRLDERWYATWERDPLDTYVLTYVGAHPGEFFRRD